MSDLFSQLQQLLLSCDESLDVTIKRDGDRLEVVIVPHLQPCALATIPPDIEQARGALGVPLYLRGTGPEVDALLKQRLQAIEGERRALSDGIDIALRALREANKKVRSKGSQKAPSPAKSSGAPSSSSAGARPDASTVEDSADEQETVVPEAAATSPSEADMSQPLSLF